MNLVVCIELNFDSPLGILEVFSDIDSCMTMHGGSCSFSKLSASQAKLTFDIESLNVDSVCELFRALRDNKHVRISVTDNVRGLYVSELQKRHTAI